MYVFACPITLCRDGYDENGLQQCGTVLLWAAGARTCVCTARPRRAAHPHRSGAVAYRAAVRESRETVDSAGEGCGAGARAEDSDTHVMGETRGVMESRHGEFMVSKPRFYLGFLFEKTRPPDRFLFGGEWNVVEV